jgi:hypothetical protein
MSTWMTVTLPNEGPLLYRDSDKHWLFNPVASRQCRSSFEIAFFRSDRSAELEFHKAFVQPQKGKMWVI